MFQIRHVTIRSVVRSLSFTFFPFPFPSSIHIIRLERDVPNITNHPDVISLIASHLGPPDQARLLRVDRASFDLVLPILYRTVKVDRHWKIYEDHGKTLSIYDGSEHPPKLYKPYALKWIETLKYTSTPGLETCRATPLELPVLKTVVFHSVGVKDCWSIIPALGHSSVKPKRIIFIGLYQALDRFLSVMMDPDGNGLQQVNVAFD